MPTAPATNAFATALGHDRRLSLLLLLNQAPANQLGVGVMHSGLSTYGHQASHDIIRADLDWLEEQGLVRLEEPAPRVVLANLTPRGQDVALGRAYVTGVRRPTPHG